MKKYFFILFLTVLSSETFSKSESPQNPEKWAPTFFFPENPFHEIEGTIFTGRTHLRDRSFEEHVLSRGPLEAQSVRFNVLAVQGPFEGTDITAQRLLIQGTAHIKNSAAVGEVKGQGHMALKNVVADSLQYSGECRLQDVKLAKSLEGHGSLFVERSVLKNVQLSGNINAIGTLFENIVVSGKRHYFEGCTLRSIVVNSGYKNPVVYLKKGTKLEETITFEGTEGTVYTDDPDSVKRKVKGGKIKTIKN